MSNLTVGCINPKADITITTKMPKRYWIEIQKKALKMYYFGDKEIPYTFSLGWQGIIKSRNGNIIFETKTYKHKSTLKQALANFCLMQNMEIREDK